MKLGRKFRQTLALVLAITFVIPTSYINTTHSTSNVSNNVAINETIENDVEVNNIPVDYIGTASLINSSSQDIVYELMN